MSDQSYQGTPARTVDGSNLINIAGGSGITSINGDATPAQFVAGAAPLSVVDAANIHTLNVATFSAVARGVVPASGGGAVNFLRADGSWVPSGSGITTINGDATPAQTIAVVAPVTIINAANVHTIGVDNFTAIARGTVPASGGGVVNFLRADGSWVPSGSGVTSINGDGTAAQVIAGINGIDIVDAGATHSIRPPGFHNFVATLGGGVAVPNGVLTPLASATIGAGAGGTYYVGYGAGVNGIAAQILDIVVRVNGALAPEGSHTGILEAAGQTCGASGNAGTLVILAPGDVVDVAVNHHGGGAATTSLPSGVYGFKIT